MDLAALEHLKCPHRLFNGSQMSDRCPLGYLLFAITAACVAAVKRLPVQNPLCRLFSTFGPLISMKLF